MPACWLNFFVDPVGFLRERLLGLCLYVMYFFPLLYYL